MDPLKPPVPSNRNRYVPIPLHHHHQPDRPLPRPHHHPHPDRPLPHPHPHPHPDRSFPHPHHHPYISPPASPYHPSRPPHDSHFHPDPRRPLPSPILNHPHDRIPADHLIPHPFREDRARLPDAALAPPGFAWDDAPRPLRRRPPFPIDWENPGPHSSDPHLHHHRGLHPPPFLETTNSAPVRRKRYDSDQEILEFTHDDRCCVDVPRDRREHHHHHHEHRHIRRRSNPPFEPFLPNSLPSSSVAVAPDCRSIEWATRNRNPFDAPEALENSSVERPERITYPFDASGPPDRGSPERAAGSRYLIDGLKPHDHSPVKKAVRTRHYIDGLKPPDHSSVERVMRIRHPPDGPRPSDQSYLERDSRIRYPFDAPKPPNRSSVERETWIRYPFDGPKPPDHSFVEGAHRGRYPCDASKPLQQRSERGDPVDEDRIWMRPPALEINKEAIKRDNDALRIIPGKRLPLHSRLGNVNNMEAHETKSQKTSVLLRIQPASKPIRKRKDEPLLSSYVIGSSTPDPKGKAPNSFSEHVSEKDSSVELDVSFKSNALVAKPIVLPPTKTVIKSNKTVLVKKKKKKIVKRVLRLPNSQVAGKNLGSTSASLRKDLQHLEVLEEGKQSSRPTGNNGAGVASSSPHKDLQKIEILEAGKVYSAGASGDTGLDLCPPGVVVLLEDSSVEGSPEAAALLEDQKSHVIHKDNNMNFVHRDGCFTSLGKELVILDSRSPSPSGLGSNLQDDIPAGTVTDGHGYSLEDRVAERDEERKDQTEVGVLEESGMNGSRNCKDTKELLSPVEEELGILSLDVQTSVFNQRSPSGVIEGDGSDRMVEVGLHYSDSMRPAEEVLAVTATNAKDEGIIHSPDRLLTINSPESLSVVPEADILNAEQSLSRPSDENLCIDDKNKPDEKSTIDNCLPLKAHDSMVSELEVGVELNQRMQTNDHIIQEKALQLPLQGTKKPKADPKLTANESGKRTHQSSGIPRSFRHPAGFASGSLKETSSSHIVRPRTWHRTDSSSASPSPVHESGLSHIPLRRPSPKKTGKIQSMSYIRKGNSLVRNSAPVLAFSRASPGSSASVYTSNPTSGDKMNNCVGSERKTESSNYSKSGVNPAIVRPKTPPLPNTTKLPNCTVKHPRDSPYSIIADPQAVSEASMCETSDPIKPTKGNDTPWSAKGSEKQTANVLLDGLETQNAAYVGKSKSPKIKKMIYVKRKSNQLVAAPRPEIQDSSVPITEKTRAFPFSTSSDFYYKRKNNQLVRNNVSLESQLKQAVVVPDDNSNSEGQRAPKISSLRCNRGLSKRRFDKDIHGTLPRHKEKVLEKTSKTAKLSLVWTLGGTQSHSKDMTSLQRRKVLPYLVPWKRTAYWRCFMNNIASVSNKSSLSLIRKLQLSRKRDTVYTRSSSGFSLRKSKVLSIGGSHLKWSKSIERHSKKANEEATLAVAAVEREKREHKGAGHIIRNAKNRSRSSRKSYNGIELQPGERIFCIGSVRYKMDQSNRTLLRIPDEKPSCSIDIKSGKDSRISFVPRRLLIGNDEYIRIGNGNQLVRDPKRLTRILASEKIRWSLHTARLRLAKKKQYCQFFTRFGKCNKDGGKCPYIHDPAKVAVCTKFLHGLCSDSDCKLTHKVIPERMQDCSYFLQGLCTNENCPYRHVNVNPDASVCDGFLRGYCADGNECRKKHSYVCPMFKENGNCPQGSTCKLHHPKNRNKSKKRKRLKNQQNARGRYFGSPMLVDIGQSGTVASDSFCAGQGGNIFFLDGQYADYISLDVGDEEAGETNNPVGANTTLCGGDSSDLQLDSLDPLIKPFLLMNENAS